MPLVPVDEEPVVVNGNVQFTMLDGTKRVICVVSGEALDDLEGSPAETAQAKLGRYHFASGKIQQAASDKYDAGVQLPIVTSPDLLS
jgi:environmental stress-induced protein Ves